MNELQPWLVAVALAGAYFIYSAIVEERNLTEQLPDTDPAYKRARPRCSCPSCSDRVLCDTQPVISRRRASRPGAAPSDAMAAP